jgi:hypothetical protein
VQRSRHRDYGNSCQSRLGDGLLDQITGAVEHRRERSDREIQLRRFDARTWTLHASLGERLVDERLSRRASLRPGPCVVERRGQRGRAFVKHGELVAQ